MFYGSYIEPTYGITGILENTLISMTKLLFEVTIQNKLGLHARPSAMLVQTTNKFKSEVLIRKNDMEVNAKSILGVMMLAAEHGTNLYLTVSGEDAEEALKAVVELFANRFDEDE
jgi:phosphotransferase system HPr (HPr) family protein